MHLSHHHYGSKDYNLFQKELNGLITQVYNITGSLVMSRSSSNDYKLCQEDLRSIIT